jgi:hypothetical protein
VISASGARTVPQPPSEVWRALAVLRPYCAVCDVSYVVPESASGAGRGATFVCVPGRVDGRAVPDTAPRGEIIDWQPPRRVTTRIALGSETWTTRIELDRADDGGTAVALTIDHEPAAGSRLVQRVQRRATQRMVQRMVDEELGKLPEHIAAAAQE